MTTLSDFIKATASYFGIPPEQLMDGSALDGSRGEIEVVLRVALTSDDVMAVAGRLEDMQAIAMAEPAIPEGPSRAERRKQWEGLSDAGRAVHGSFYRFTQSLGDADPYASPEVQSTVELPAHVYLPPEELTEQQKVMAVGRDARGWYAMDPNDLSGEQFDQWAQS